MTRLALIAAAAAFHAGCDSGGSDSTPAPGAVLTQIDVSAAAAPTLVAFVGETLQFTATGTYSDGSTADLTEAVTWTCAQASVAVISNDSGSRGLATLSAAGSTEITATHPESGLSGSVTVSVFVVSLDISPIDPSLLIGTSLQLTATATIDDEDGTTVDRTGSVTWTSSDETVATISPGGLVTALELGTTTITAVDPLSGASATTIVRVTDVVGLSYVILSRGSVIGGSSVEVTGTVVLTAITPDPFAVELWAVNQPPNDEIVVTVPGSVVVSGGADRVSFTVTTMPVAKKTRVFVWASDGTVEKSASLNVRKQR